jgi:hypothetical protein
MATSNIFTIDWHPFYRCCTTWKSEGERAAKFQVQGIDDIQTSTREERQSQLPNHVHDPIPKPFLKRSPPHSATNLDIELFLKLLEFIFFRLVRLDELFQCILDLRCGWSSAEIRCRCDRSDSRLPRYNEKGSAGVSWMIELIQTGLTVFTAPSVRTWVSLLTSTTSN